jgi:nitrile hydratase subunit alpha
LNGARFRATLVQQQEPLMNTFDSDSAARAHQHLHTALPSDSALRVKALESLVVERGMVAQGTLDAWVEAYSEVIGPKRGAEVVARSWLDSDFRARLLADAGAVVAELGYQGHASSHLKAIENSDETHNIVVCTLCSCYPFSVLGMSPSWYKSAAYRSRVVREPRAVLAEFGVELADDVAVNVWDSTAELRYLVIPQRPAGTDGWDLAALSALVTRNSMIGTQRDLALPGGGA